MKQLCVPRTKGWTMPLPEPRSSPASPPAWPRSRETSLLTHQDWRAQTPARLGGLPSGPISLGGRDQSGTRASSGCAADSARVSSPC